MRPTNVMLKKIFEKSGLTKKELAEKMNYKNINKGMSQIHEFFYGGYDNAEFRERLKKQFILSEREEIIAKELDEQFDILNDEISRLQVFSDLCKQYRAFSPYFEVLTDPPGSTQIATGMSRAYWKYGYNQRINSEIKKTEEPLVEILLKVINEHFTENNGVSAVPSKAILGYKFIYNTKKTFVFGSEKEKIVLKETIETKEKL